MSIFNTLLQRANNILQSEGVSALVRRGLEFVIGLPFKYQTYYLCQYAPESHRKFREADFRPNIDELTFKIISTNYEADELEAQGFQFRSYFSDARKRLDKGAIAFCSFINRDLSDIGWVAMDEEAAKSLWPPPLRVDFCNKEVVVGGVVTMPKY